MDRKLCGHETDAIISVLQPLLFFKNFESLFNTILGQDDIICDDFGWWSGFNKGGDRIDDVEIGLGDVVEGMETNNQDDPSYGAPIGYSVILADGGRIP